MSLFRTLSCLSCLALVLGGGLQAAENQNVLSPEQAYDLYAKALINVDAQSARSLNAALGPLFEDKEVLDFQEMLEKRADALTEAIQEVQDLIPESSQATLDPVIRDMLTQAAEAPRRTQCKATGSTIAPDGKTARVTFACDVVEISAFTDYQTRLKQTKFIKFDEEKMKYSIEKVIASLKTARPTRRINGEIVFVSPREGYWVTSDISTLMSPLRDFSRLE